MSLVLKVKKNSFSKKGFKLRNIFILFLILFVGCNYSKQKNKSNIIYLNSIFVETNINNSKGIFVLDNGVSLTIYDSTFLQQNDIVLDCIGTTKIIGAGNSNPIMKELYSSSEFYIFEKKVESNAIIYDLKSLSPVEDGIVGLDFFLNYTFEIDYINQNISFNKELENIDSSYIKIPLCRKGNLFFVEMELIINSDKSIKGDFLVDIGSEYAITLNNYISDSLALNEKTKKIKVLKNNGGIGGQTKRFLIKCETAQLNDFKINNILVACSENQKGATGNSQKFGIGIIGNLFFEKFDIIFNLKNNAIYLKPNENYYKDFTYYRSGIILGEPTKDGFYINEFIPVSSNYIDLEKNDIIVKINNQYTLDLGYFNLKQMLQTKGTYTLEIIRRDSVFYQKIHIKDLMNNI